MIRILAIGKNKDKALRQLEEEYKKRISGFDKVEILEFKDDPDRKGEEQKTKDTEAARVLEKIKDRDFVVLLDLHGKMPDSETFARQMEDWRTRGNLTFVIAGSLGPGTELVKRADVRLKLSDLTFTHLMTRVLLLEQVYRAFMINGNRHYHK